ncbi:polyribonucleotide nucleotidyltransferase [Helicobacter mustelae]|uniref:Polyribonucleotide nucleotidyltransferase n=1 Tax=Helicobacter mustelae (strain ATCC 43772 / CCUG 25715 / CIP 103759 / LMG 18044 / NCTC 12198 / R85-136P) TaxID=679897 RepID=D3UHN2_HELM1|nr:polyribonucleotide nucleotidyltransferase [Helicobacter mustelae]CBG40004.1 polyribonucleotide nucleotidyltransferase [Helicobacter mustelae 12198]SQH71516.1 polyribonucleotide nucleotidyltransferase [Helicobacter mustelae]
MQKIDIVLEDYKECYKLDYVAKQASGSVLYERGGTVILASVAIDDKDVEGDFLPLSVQYIEKSYATGKIPGGFIKREGKPGEFETLTSRIIDRTLRPLFPKHYRKTTHISVFVLSYDGESDLQVCALNAAANALLLSAAPFCVPTAAVRIGRIDGVFVLNPSRSELANSALDLYISGSFGDLLMIEMKGGSTKESGINEEELLEAITLAKAHIQELSSLYEQNIAPHKKAPLALPEKIELFDEEIDTLLKQEYFSRTQEILNQMSKSERNKDLESLGEEIYQKYQNFKPWSLEQVQYTLWQYKKQVMRNQVLERGIRADGRKTTEVRPISIETNILPFAHGSVLFTRGQTQSLVVATLGSENDAQTRENLNDSIPQKENFTFHYNFPGFSVGEALMIGSVGRRELGHGNLAKKALEDSIIEKDRTLRLVSEILESNGSSSMASVCGGSLAICACGMESSGLVAGVAMGLIKEGSEYAVLTDIMGLEDHDGDMDFKVAGNENFITAMQMDIKLGGLELGILKEALYQARDARLHILQIMQEARARIVVNHDIIPKVETFCVPPSKIIEIIGSGGKTIKEIIERFGVSIDLDREKGEVKVFATNAKTLQDCKNYILQIIGSQGYVENEIFLGVVKKIVDFGVFVSLPRGGDGLLHISKFAQDKSKKSSDYFQEGQKISCKILGFNKGKVDLDLVR